MDKIDRLGWADGISFRSYGVSVGVRVSDHSVMDIVRELLPPGWKPSTRPLVDRLYSLFVGGEARRGVRRFNLLYRDASLLGRSLSLEELCDVFQSDLKLHVAEKARRRVFVHAGVVGWRGVALLIPGRSFSGKTTLVAELVRAGADYYSDEYAVLDAEGRVHPFPQPLGIRAEGAARQERVAAEDLGGRPGKRPLKVGLILATKYRPNAHWRPRELTHGQGVLELLANAVAAREDPGGVLSFLSRATEGARVLGGPRGDARVTAAQILGKVI
ncbi:MAG: hypothetical protein JOZ96_19480 [Acidobacteria bacterium]|nr:hypothetical protein [Acidobacteriota bacterium]